MIKISDSEEIIMSIIWTQDGCVNLQKITEECKNKFQKEWMPQTISTFIARLRRKGFVEIQKVGRMSNYIPLIKREQYVKFLVNEIRDRYILENEKIEDFL